MDELGTPAGIADEINGTVVNIDKAAEDTRVQNAKELASHTVMVACPAYKGKSYALEAYLSAYNDFTWPYRSIYMVDGTATGLDYFEHLKSLGVPCEHINPGSDWDQYFIQSWKCITEEAVRRKVMWVASIEHDNICPPLTLDAMLNLAHFTRAVHVAHGYRWHASQSNMGRLIGLGCNLILTELLQEIYAQPKWYTDTFESELFEYPKIKNYPCVEVYNMLDVRHLDAPDGVEFYHFRKDKLPELTHGNVGERVPTKYNKKD